MNQTVTINISGIVFHIEVDAYENLKNYLNKIKSYFNNSEERDEIMMDIEARIAELFNQKITTKNQVIVMNDVAEIIEIMGKPEQYIGEDEENIDEETKRTYTSSKDKKVFRNPDERTLGGVCSGLAAYFGFDTIWLRLFFVLATIFFGFGPVLYLILWVVIPEAKTASDKLKMKGENVNIDNIGKTFKEGADRVSENLKNINTSKIGHALEEISAAIASVLIAIFKIAGKVLGVALLCIGLFLACWFIIGLFDDSIVLSYTSSGVSAIESGELFELIFSSHDHFIIFLTAAIIVVGLPILGLIYGGIKLLFKVKGNTAVSVSLSILWFVAFFTALTIGLTTASNQKATQKYSQTQQLNVTNNSYTITAFERSIPGEMMFEIEDFTLSIDEQNFYSTEVEMNIEKSDNNKIEIETIYTSKGKTKKDATQKVKNINYLPEITDSTIVLSHYFSALKEDRLRGQKVKVILKIPVGKTIYLDKSIKNIIYDIDNVTNTWDSEMLGKNWVMLDDGLTCLDCLDIKGISSAQLDSIKLNNVVVEEKK